MEQLILKTPLTSVVTAEPLVKAAGVIDPHEGDHISLSDVQTLIYPGNLGSRSFVQLVDRKEVGELKQLIGEVRLSSEVVLSVDRLHHSSNK